MREGSMKSHLWRVGIAFLPVASVLATARVSAQAAPSGPLSLKDAIQLALTNYPRLTESRARADAADAGIALARTAYLPRLDMLWQENLATRNNVFGLLLPQSIVPPISGPVLGTRSFDSVWGSAAGVQLSWEAVDFGLRKANVDAARAQRSFAKAQTALTELDVAAAADAFVTVLASDEVVRAAQANVDRLQVFGSAVRTLVAIVAIFLLMAANFQSWRLAFVVLSTVPAVILGVVLALLMTGTTLNVQSYMGAIMAIGVSVANAILLVTFAEQVRRGGREVEVAVMAGVRSRMRPILMTSLAMIAGMIPMALALGQGGEQTAPLGRAVIGGLMASTVTVLIVLPAVFATAQRGVNRGSGSWHPDDSATA